MLNVESDAKSNKATSNLRVCMPLVQCDSWNRFGKRLVVLKGRKVSVVTLKMQAPRVDTAIYSFEFISSASARRDPKGARAV